MVIAGEASGDALAAGLVKSLSQKLTNRPRFFGAGGPRMAQAGVALEFDMTAQAAIGISDVIKKLPVFRRIFRSLLQIALERQPDLIVLVDFGGFNRRFASAIRREARGSWKPKIVQYVSPQVWASRPGRAKTMVRDLDLLLCLFPFEKEWYAQREP